jgi:hypothetical protein
VFVDQVFGMGIAIGRQGARQQSTLLGRASSSLEADTYGNPRRTGADKLNSPPESRQPRTASLPECRSLISIPRRVRFRRKRRANRV